MRVAIVGLALCCGISAWAAPCPPGRFEPTVPLFGGTATAVVVGADGTVTLEGCDTPVRTLGARRRGTTLRAAWLGCGDAGPFRLRVRLRPRDCDVLQGRVRPRDGRRLRFTALRVVSTTTTTTTTSTTSTTSPEPPAPGALEVVIDGTVVRLAWNAPPPPYTDVRVLRRLDVAPTAADDPAADVVYAGPLTTAAHDVAALLPSTSGQPRTYHYAAFDCRDGADCGATAARATLAPSLVDVLRGGGYVLHWRHASADVCADRTDLGKATMTSYPDWWKRCDAVCPGGEATTATARQLNAAGVAEAIAIGERFDALGIPIGRVASSEFCRNVTTAALMDFGPPIEQRSDITYWVYDEPGRCAATYTLIEEAPAPGTNTAIIGHAGFTCAFLDQLQWGEAAIFRPDGQGGVLWLARVPWNAW